MNNKKQLAEFEQQKLIKETKKFLHDVCKKEWGMTNQEVKIYCAMVAAQNASFSKFGKEYKQVANAYSVILNLFQDL